MERHFAYGVTRICRELPENLFVNYFVSIGEAKPEPHLALLVNSIDYNSFNSSARSVLSLQIADEPKNGTVLLSAFCTKDNDIIGNYKNQKFRKFTNHGSLLLAQGKLSSPTNS